MFFRFPLSYLFKIGFVRKGLHLVSRVLHSHPVNSVMLDKLPNMEEGDSKFAFRGKDDEAFESKFAFRPHTNTFVVEDSSVNSMELANVVVDPVSSLGTSLPPLPPPLPFSSLFSR